MTEVVVYTKQGCHLCERVIAKLEEIGSAASIIVSTRDITEDQELFERYRFLIPVVLVNGKVRLAGAALTDPNTLENVLRKAIFPS